MMGLVLIDSQIFMWIDFGSEDTDRPYTGLIFIFRIIY